MIAVAAQVDLEVILKIAQFVMQFMIVPLLYFVWRIHTDFQDFKVTVAREQAIVASTFLSKSDYDRLQSAKKENHQ